MVVCAVAMAAYTLSSAARILWRKGAIIRTPLFPNGRRIRVILVGVFCDKPAAHKVGGFASHSTFHFCTLDWIWSFGLRIRHLLGGY